MKQPTEYRSGYIFKVPTLQQFIDIGWKQTDQNSYEHPDYGTIFLSGETVKRWQGKTLTVAGVAVHSPYAGWYPVEENYGLWPVRACDQAFGTYDIQISYGAQIAQKPHVCLEGSTPLMGYAICKLCGKNLRKLGS